MTAAESIDAYCASHTDAESPLLRSLAEETRRVMSVWQMMVGPVEGAFLRNMARVAGARRILEVGTFTGYSALWMADGLPRDGELITCDVDPAATEIARRYFAKSPHGHKIGLEMGDARETLRRVVGPFDLVFIDADKENYIHYWNAAIELVPSGGVILVDNVLWSGKALAPDDDVSRAIAAFNEYAHADSRASKVMLPIRDGVLFASKK